MMATSSLSLSLSNCNCNCNCNAKSRRSASSVATVPTAILFLAAEFFLALCRCCWNTGTLANSRRKRAFSFLCPFVKAKQQNLSESAFAVQPQCEPFLPPGRVKWVFAIQGSFNLWQLSLCSPLSWLGPPLPPRSRKPSSSYPRH